MTANSSPIILVPFSRAEIYYIFLYRCTAVVSISTCVIILKSSIVSLRRALLMSAAIANTSVAGRQDCNARIPSSPLLL